MVAGIAQVLGLDVGHSGGQKDREIEAPPREEGLVPGRRRHVLLEGQGVLPQAHRRGDLSAGVERLRHGRAGGPRVRLPHGDGLVPEQNVGDPVVPGVLPGQIDRRESRTQGFVVAAVQAGQVQRRLGNVDVVGDRPGKDVRQGQGNRSFGRPAGNRSQRREQEDNLSHDRTPKPFRKQSRIKSRIFSGDRRLGRNAISSSAIRNSDKR